MIQHLITYTQYMGFLLALKDKTLKHYHFILVENNY